LNVKRKIRICVYCSYSIDQDNRCRCMVACSNEAELIAKVILLGETLQQERLADNRENSLANQIRQFIRDALKDEKNEGE